MSKFKKLTKIIDSLLKTNDDVENISEKNKKKILLLAKTLTKQCSKNSESC